ncbi:MAG: tRNA (adenosine(37)-N6)-threonylcarbamoyltransferase complex transferase subunit TsaD [Sphingomonadales bacterium 17-56-6]|nr:MAG: tRNA (adenosine(37)-N6)-threonylcarbamoyltransferase complex transferase subunit TsaD [Sphingomonadales bacterium 17-56-6]
MAIILGLESSCDETAAAIVRSDRAILSHALAGQEDHHRAFGGVVPEIAARAHAELMTPLVETALADAGLTLNDVDAIAATAGPGLIGGVMVGLVTAKALAMASGKPLIAVNHLEGHALSPRLIDADLHFPYIDDAVGEAFDKTAKILGLGFPGGPAVERAAAIGNPRNVPLPRPLKGADEPHFSFAGLKSAVLRAHETGQYKVEDIAASFQLAVIDCLYDRITYTLDRIDAPAALVVAGGVAANVPIREMLEKLAEQRNMRFVAPPLWLCTDNGVMIAWAGAERFAMGLTDGLDFVARPRWPLDPHAAPARGAGVKA